MRPRGAIAFVAAIMLGAALAAGLSSTAGAQTSSGTAGAQATASYTPAASGELDCNGYSPVQKPVRADECTDIRGIQGVDNSNTWGGQFYDNGVYIGHDEPDTTFLSTAPARVTT